MTENNAEVKVESKKANIFVKAKDWAKDHVAEIVGTVAGVVVGGAVVLLVGYLGKEEDEVLELTDAEVEIEDVDETDEEEAA